LIVGIVATFAATLVPRNRPIAIACVTMFVGFLVGAVCHVAGW
jgi:hypothetical protein